MPIFTITETLFGGLIIAWFLFYISRTAKLSVFWASIISGAVPFLAYMAYANVHWAGGDVVAIHLALFMANAGLLMVFNKPQKEKMHIFPKLIIGFFVTLVVLNAAFLSIASKGLPDSVATWLLPNPDHETVHTGFPGVLEHDNNKSYTPHLQRINAQRALGWHVELVNVAHLKVDTPQTMTIRLLDVQNKPILNAKVQVVLSRFADQADDQTLTLKANKTGDYEASVLLKYPGRWQITTIAELGDDVFQTSKMLFTE